MRRLLNRSRLRSSRALWIASTLVVFGAMAYGCGESSSGDCTDKATCAETSDGSSSGDVAQGQDVSANDSAQGDASLPDNWVNDVAIDSFVLPDGPVDVKDGCSAGEDCTNGIDDNCDGKTDCEDSLCQSGYTCVGAIPGGWTGPVTLFDATGTPPPAPPACSGVWPNDAVDGHADPNAPAAQCGCTCGAPSSQQCQFVSASVYADTACQTACGSSVGLPPNFCVATGCTAQNAQSYIASPPAPTGGSCAAAPTSNVPAWSWTRIARACEYAGPNDNAGCGGGKCVAKPPSSFGPLCVFAAGDIACPSGAYSVKHTYYASANDTRACSACTCGSPAGGTCAGGQVSLYSTSTCSMGQTTFPLSSTCKPIASTQALGVEATATTPSGGACPANGGQPQGAVQATGATTVCCMP